MLKTFGHVGLFLLNFGDILHDSSGSKNALTVATAVGRGAGNVQLPVTQYRFPDLQLENNLLNPRREYWETR